MKVIKDWVEKNIIKILGFEDEFLVNFVMNLIENQSDEPRKIELQLRGNFYEDYLGFLTDSTEIFMKELWSLLIQAQNSESGIPEVLLKEKEEELRANSERNLEKVKFLEKMLGEKETNFEKYEDMNKRGEKLEKDKKIEKPDKYNTNNYKPEIRDAKNENKNTKYDRKEKDRKRSDYHHSSSRKSYSYSDRSRSRSRSTSRTRSRDKNRKRNESYRDEKSSRRHRDDNYRDNNRHFKRDRSIEKERYKNKKSH